jgi:hypothetical protein
MAKAHLERHQNPCGTVRLYDAGSYNDNSDFRIAITAEFINGQTVVLRGVDKPLKLSDYRAIGKALAKEGFDECRVLRNGRWKKFKLTRFNSGPDQTQISCQRTP